MLSDELKLTFRHLPISRRASSSQSVCSRAANSGDCRDHYAFSDPEHPSVLALALLWLSLVIGNAQ
jgi:hypothetical protein